MRAYLVAGQYSSSDMLRRWITILIEHAFGDADHHLGGLAAAGGQLG